MLYCTRDSVPGDSTRNRGCDVDATPIPPLHQMLPGTKSIKGPLALPPTFVRHLPRDSLRCDGHEMPTIFLYLFARRLFLELQDPLCETRTMIAHSI